LCLKFRKKLKNLPTQVNLIDDDFGIVLELFLFASNIKMKICDVLESFFLRENIKKKLLTCFLNILDLKKII
jgi:hypothetical protein